MRKHDESKVKRGKTTPKGNTGSFAGHARMAPDVSLLFKKSDDPRYVPGLHEWDDGLTDAQWFEERGPIYPERDMLGDNEMVFADAGPFSIELGWHGDGLDGDYNPYDPDDRPTISVQMALTFDGEAGVSDPNVDLGWAATRIDARTPKALLQRLVETQAAGFAARAEGLTQAEVETMSRGFVADLESIELLDALHNATADKAGLERSVSLHDSPWDATPSREYWATNHGGEHYASNHGGL